MVDLSNSLKAALEQAQRLAREREQEVHPQHLLLALVGDPDAAAVFDDCAVDKDKFKEDIREAIDIIFVFNDKKTHGAITSPVHLILSEAKFDAENKGKEIINGADILVNLTYFYGSEVDTILQKFGITEAKILESIIRIEGAGDTHKFSAIDLNRPRGDSPDEPTP